MPTAEVPFAWPLRGVSLSLTRSLTRSLTLRLTHILTLASLTLAFCAESLARSMVTTRRASREGQALAQGEAQRSMGEHGIGSIILTEVGRERLKYGGARGRMRWHRSESSGKVRSVGYAECGHAYGSMGEQLHKHGVKDEGEIGSVWASK